MEASTIPAATTDETAVSPVTFHSEASNYRVVMEPMRNQRVGETNATETVGGKDIQFYDGIFVATTQEEIDFLRGYESNGSYYWEVGSPEDKPDDSAGLQGRIIELALADDQAGIADILVAERTSQSRPAVIAACVAALDKLGADQPPKSDVPLHELQRVRTGPTAGVTPGVSPDPVPGSPLVDPSTLVQPDGGVAAPVPQPSAAETSPPSEIPVEEAPQVPPAPPAAPEETPPVADSAGAAGAPAAPVDPAADQEG